MSKKKIDDAILTLEVLIDCCKEDGTTYNAIKEWEALEVFKNLANRINKAIEYIENNTMYFDSEYARDFGELCTIPGAGDTRTHCVIGDKQLLEILKGEENN